MTNTNEKLSGTKKSDLINRKKSDDNIAGLKGSDVLKGAEGKGNLIGSKGNDYLDSQKGTDLLKGDKGADAFQISKRTDAIKDFSIKCRDKIALADKSNYKIIDDANEALIKPSARIKLLLKDANNDVIITESVAL